MCRLMEIRKAKGISQWRLAFLARVFQSKISLCENGLITLKEEEKRRISEILQKPIEEIFKEEKGLNTFGGIGHNEDS